jgi:glutamyl-tRNA reductase
VLQDWVGRALHIGKSVRHAARGLITATDVEDTCEMFLEHECGRVRNRRILVIGSGMIGGALAQRFISAGARVSCCYRSNPPQLAGSTGNDAVLFPLSALDREIRKHEIIVCATRCDTPLLTGKHAKLLGRDHRTVVVDLGVPRNVAPGFKNTAPDIALFDLDDIKRFRNNTDTGLQQALDKGDEIISGQMECYDRIMAGIQGGVRKPVGRLARSSVSHMVNR